MANVQSATKTVAESSATGVQVTDNPIEAAEKGLLLRLPANTVVECFRFVELSKGGQFACEQERELPEEVLKIAPYMRGMQKPALFNEYRGNPLVYLSGQTMTGKGFTSPEKQLRRFAIAIIPL